MWAVETATFRESERFGPDQAARLVTNPRARVLVAEVGGEMGGVVVGWAAMLIRRHRNGCSGRLYTIAVLPGFAGRGLGRRLATETLALIAGEGVGRVFLEVREDNAPAIALYESLGFRTVARLPGYYGESGPGLRMRRDACQPAPVHRTAPVGAAQIVNP